MEPCRGRRSPPTSTLEQCWRLSLTAGPPPHPICPRCNRIPPPRVAVRFVRRRWENRPKAAVEMLNRWPHPPRPRLLALAAVSHHCLESRDEREGYTAREGLAGRRIPIYTYYISESVFIKITNSNCLLVCNISLVCHLIFSNKFYKWWTNTTSYLVELLGILTFGKLV
jgi:hypothetical protein